RMVLEAVEDHRRGYHLEGKQLAGSRVTRNKFSIEHIMPQHWEASWPRPTSGTIEDRAQRIHALGNLTLLHGKLNTSVSNGPWTGENGKRAALKKHDLLHLNRDLDSWSTGEWTDESITNRTNDLIEIILKIWPVPPGHKSSTLRKSALSLHSVDLADLLS